MVNLANSTPTIRALFVLLALIFAAPIGVMQTTHLYYKWLPSQGVIGKQAMVVSAHAIASQIGRDVLTMGGNAFDAAVAVNFALAVVYQQAGNIGGGGFMVYRLANGEAGALDYREVAPLAASRDMYLDDNGDVLKGASLTGHLAVGVPGTVAGMEALHEKFGSKNWASLIAPAIALARDGFTLTPKAANMFNRYQKDFVRLNHTIPAVFKQDDWRAGAQVQFPDLAVTLTRIAEQKSAGFYKGETARLIVEEMRTGGGLISQKDLDSYRVQWRKPIRINYRGYEIITMPPSSSGGVALAQLLKGAEIYDIAAMKHNSATHIHIMTELARRAYADRATFLGDNDFVDVPIGELTSRDYIAQRIANIDLTYKTDSRAIKEGYVERMESAETTHFSIVDKQGNAVAITTTLNGNFGSRVYVAGAGFFLNNEMDDFAIAPNHPNQFGLLGNEQNAIAPQKRMLSSMTPTIIEKDGTLKAVLGTPGGATIITSVFQTILNLVDFDMSAQQAVDARKAHSQWQPDVIMLERGTMSIGNMWGLRKRGHRLYPHPQFQYTLGRVELILVREDGTLEGAADITRGFDDHAVGF